MTTTSAIKASGHEIPQQRHTALAVLLIVGGILGLRATFALTMDEFTTLQHPAAKLDCFVNALVQCGPNLASWQGSVFGFPNPLIGLVAFLAPIVVGVALLGRVQFPAWFLALFNIGMLFAIVFIAWLVSQSIWTIHTICPWCALVYLAVIPMSLAVTFFNLKEGNLRAGHRLSALGSALLSWTPIISLGAYLAILVCAQLRLDLIRQFFPAF